MADLWDRLRGTVIVSCQAYPGEPMRTPETMRRVAESCVLGGASAIRAQGIDDLREIRDHLDVPLIGLVKEGAAGVVITPTRALAVACAEIGCEVVAVDGTTRERPDGVRLAAVIDAVHDAGALVMADVSTPEDALYAQRAGADVVGTTLGGYTPYSPMTSGPDLDLLRATVAECSVPVIAEGRYDHPDQVRTALDLGALAVAVGTAITHPMRLTERFVAASDRPRR